MPIFILCCSYIANHTVFIYCMCSPAPPYELKEFFKTETMKANYISVCHSPILSGIYLNTQLISLVEHMQLLLMCSVFREEA